MGTAAGCRAERMEECNARTNLCEAQGLPGKTVYGIRTTYAVDGKEWEKKKKEGTLQVPYNVMEFDNRLAKCGGVTPLKYQTWWKKVCTMGWRAEAEMADEDEADEDEDEEGGRRTATLGDIKIAVSCDTEWY